MRDLNLNPTGQKTVAILGIFLIGLKVEKVKESAHHRPKENREKQTKRTGKQEREQKFLSLVATRERNLSF